MGNFDTSDLAQRQLSINDYNAAKRAHDAETARQKKSGSWGGWGRLLGSIGGGLLGLALAPFTGGTTAGMGALGAGIGSGVGTAVAQQWAGGMHGQRTSMGQSKNPFTGEMQDIRDPEVEKQFESDIAEFSDKQRNLRTTRALTDAASTYFMPKALEKIPQGMKSTWNKFAGNTLGLGEGARFPVPGLEKGTVLDFPKTGILDSGVGRLPVPQPAWNPLQDAFKGAQTPINLQKATSAIPSAGNLSGVLTNMSSNLPSLANLAPPIQPGNITDLYKNLANFGTTPIRTLNNTIQQDLSSPYGLNFLDDPGYVRRQ